MEIKTIIRIMANKINNIKCIFISNTDAQEWYVPLILWDFTENLYPMCSHNHKSVLSVPV